MFHKSSISPNPFKDMVSDYEKTMVYEYRLFSFKLAIKNMTQDIAVISKCRDIRLNDSIFKKYNRPARVLTLLAIVVPIAILYPTSGVDENGEIDFTTSPYAIPSGIIFLSGVVIAYFLSKKASRYKIRTSQKWAVHALNVYENINEYERTSAPDDYKEKAEKNLDGLISDIQSKIDESDKRIQWIIPFVSPIDDLITILDNEIFPLVEGGDKTKIPIVKSYLVKLMNYFLSPSDSLLTQLLSEQIPSDAVEHRVTTIETKRPLPFHNVGLFGIFFAVGVATFFLAIGLEVDKNSAFLAAAGITGALSGGYFVYMKK